MGAAINFFANKNFLSATRLERSTFVVRSRKITIRAGQQGRKILYVTIYLYQMYKEQKNKNMDTVGVEPTQSGMTPGVQPTKLRAPYNLKGPLKGVGNVDASRATIRFISSFNCSGVQGIGFPRECSY